MAEERGRAGDPALHTFPGTATRFRGPPPDLSGDYVVALGGCDTFGRYVPRPFPALLADGLGVEVANLGLPAGGLDAYLRDPGLRAVLAGARAAVVQAVGAHALSNRFYRVHPRRNDRFLRQSEALAALYPDVDFAQFAFARHLVSTLRATDAARFAAVRRELRVTWEARMHELLDLVPCPTILLDVRGAPAGALGAEPALVSEAMVDAVAGRAHALRRVDVAGLVGEGRMDGMSYHFLEHHRAATHLTVAAHEAIHAALRDALADALAPRRAARRLGPPAA